METRETHGHVNTVTRAWGHEDTDIQMNEDMDTQRHGETGARRHGTKVSFFYIADRLLKTT